MSPVGYNVRKTGDGRVISWNGKPLDYRINWANLNADRRLRVQQALEDMAPRIGSGLQNGGQTSQEPASGQDAYELAPRTVYVWAKNFGSEIPGAVAWADVHWVGDEYLGAVVIFNKEKYSDPVWGPLPMFKNICWHEAGHVGGLLHPSAGDQVMSAQVNPLPYRSGDLQGFAVLKAAH